MPGMPVVVVGGIKPLADALLSTGQFPEVITAATVRELVAVLTSPAISQRSVDDLLFVFGDTVIADDPSLTLGEVLRRLTGAGYQAIVVTVTPKGAELQRANPRAGLLALPLYLNDVLFAIGTFGYPVAPVADEGGPIDLTALTESALIPAAAPAAIAPEPPSPAMSPAAQPPQVAPPAPAAAAPPPAAPVGGGWKTPDAPLLDTPAPSATPSPASTPFAAPNPFAGSSPTPPAVSPAPFTTPAVAPAPTPLPAPPAPFTAPASPAVPTGTPSYGTPDAPPRPTLGTGGGAPAWQPPSVVPRDAGQYTAAPIGQQRRGMVITIAVSKGGVGKSSMTLNLAAFLAMRLRSQGKQVAVIDANIQQADSGKYLDTYTPNINTILNNPALMTPQRITEALVHKPEYNLSVLLGPATPDEGNPLALTPRVYNEVLDLLRAHYDYIFIDTPVAEKYHEMFNKFALVRADYLIVPVAPNFQTLHNADNWLRAAVIAPEHAYGAGLDPSRVGIVLNRAEDGIGCSEEDVRQTMASWHFLGAIPETKEWKAANNRNELVAPKNYAELSQAFAEVLHAATGEPVLLENLGLVQDSGGGLVGTLKGLFRRSR